MVYIVQGNSPGEWELKSQNYKLTVKIYGFTFSLTRECCFGVMISMASPQILQEMMGSPDIATAKLPYSDPGKLPYIIVSKVSNLGE